MSGAFFPQIAEILCYFCSNQNIYLGLAWFIWTKTVHLMPTVFVFRPSRQRGNLSRPVLQLHTTEPTHLNMPPKLWGRQCSSRPAWSPEKSLNKSTRWSGRVLFFTPDVVTDRFATVMRHEDSLLRGLWRSLVSLVQSHIPESNRSLKAAYVIEPPKYLRWIRLGLSARTRISNKYT